MIFLKKRASTLFLLSMSLPLDAAAASPLHLADLQPGQSYMAELKHQGLRLQTHVMAVSNIPLLGQIHIIEACISNNDRETLSPGISEKSPLNHLQLKHPQYSANIPMASASDKLTEFTPLTNYHCDDGNPDSEQEALRAITVKNILSSPDLTEGTLYSGLRRAIDSAIPRSQTVPPIAEVSMDAEVPMTFSGGSHPLYKAHSSTLQGRIKHVEIEGTMRRIRPDFRHISLLTSTSQDYDKEGRAIYIQTRTNVDTQDLHLKWQGDRIAQIEVKLKVFNNSSQNQHHRWTYRYDNKQLSIIDINPLNDSSGDSDCIKYVYDADWIFSKRCSAPSISLFHTEGPRVLAGFIEHPSGTLASLKTTTPTQADIVEIKDGRLLSRETFRQGVSVGRMTARHKDGDKIHVDLQSQPFKPETVSGKSIEDFFVGNYRQESAETRVSCDYDYVQRDEQLNPLRMLITCNETQGNSKEMRYEYDVRLRINYY